MKFAIAIEPGTDKTAFGVVVPDLPGCFSAGDTIEEAFDNAREAIELYVETLAEDGRDLPAPKPLAEWVSSRDYRGWVWAMVDVHVERFFGPAEKINITVPARILKQIDAYAKATGGNRSNFMTSAAVAVMRRAPLDVNAARTAPGSPRRGKGRTGA